MQMMQYYLRLRERYQDVAEGVPQEITLPQLGEIFCCTERNAKLVIKQFVHRQWIEWTPGRGRGHVSRVTFLCGVEHVVLAQAQECVRQGDVEKALQLVQDSHFSAHGKEGFLSWLSEQFGFRTEPGDERPLDTLRMSFYRTIPALDPAFVGRRTESHMVNQIFDTLIRYDESTGAYQPHLAHHWEANEEGTEWTIYLRKGVQFHHGRELTADDVVWTLRRIADKAIGSPYRWMLQDLVEVSALSPYKLRIKLKRSNHMWLSILASNRLSIVPRDIVQQKKEAFSSEPIGSGPFRLTRNDERLFVLEAFPHYFQGRAHLDRVEIWIVSAISQWLLTAHDGKEDNEHLRQSTTIRELRDEWRALQQVEMGCKYIMYNLNRGGIVQNQVFRETVDRLLDRDSMIAQLGEERHRPANSFLIEQAKENQYQPPLQLEKARHLLQACGYQGETINLYTYQGAGNEKDVCWVQERLREAGVSVIVKAVTIEELKQPNIALQADLLLAGEVFEHPLLIGMIEMYRSDRSFIRMLCDVSLREGIDDTLDRAMCEPDLKQQQQDVHDVETLLKERAAISFLYHSTQQISYHEALAGVSLTALGLVKYKDIWFQSGE